MKPPWVGRGQESSELEALQTDVMRFIAILGLCLAAIFSLVHSAAREHRQAMEEVADVLQVAPVAVDLPARVPVPPGEPEKPSNREEQGDLGFTLEFSSEQALLQLLREGRVMLYLSSGQQFWSVDASGSRIAARAPEVYYQMARDTVPAALRGSEPIGGMPVWGVTLASDISARIGKLVNEHEQGSLAITVSGEVILEQD